MQVLYTFFASKICNLISKISYWFGGKQPTNMAMHMLFCMHAIFLLVQPIKAQEVSLFIQSTQPFPIEYQKKHPSISVAKNYITQVMKQLQQKGYVTSLLDSITENNQQVTAFIFLGKQFAEKNIALIYNSTEVEQLPKFIPHIQALENATQQIIQAHINTGFPFCKVIVDSIQENKQQQLQVYITAQKGLLYVADSVVVTGNLNISNRFISKYLQIQQGTLYNEKLLQQVDNKLNQLPFLQTFAPSNITMLASKYRVNVYATPKKSNQINVLVGLLPNNNQTNGKTLVTGEATLQLHNAFATGEYLYLHWQQLQPQTPLLDIQWKQPYIFNSNWSSNIQFNLFKRDTSFLNINTLLSGQYQIATNEHLQVGVQWFNTNSINVDTATVRLTKQLPTVADTKSSLLNVAYFKNSFNNSINPSKGSWIEVQANAGTKRVIRNAQIEQLSNGGFNYGSLYDSIQLNTYQVKINAVIKQVLPLPKNKLLFTQLHAGWLQSGNYFTNELFRIGGIKLLRGFDEESILASKFLVLSTAYRLQLGTSGYFETFIDASLTNNSVLNTNYSFISAGFGLALQSKQGLLNISIANGKQNNLPFNMRQTKLHIGFISLF